jgi:hypothetical protein
MSKLGVAVAKAPATPSFDKTPPPILGWGDETLDTSNRCAKLS